MTLANEIPGWRFAFEAVDELFDREFDRDAMRTREYMMTHRPDHGDGRTISELLFARRRRAIEKHSYFLGCLRPERPPLTDEQLIERYGYSPEQLRSLGGLFKPRREEEG